MVKLGIEMRKNGNSYYYRKTRRHGRVVSEYAGSGEFAMLSYQLDTLDRRERLEAAATRREQRRAEQAKERDAWRLLAEAQRLAALAMLAVGHHRHKGQWRKRRNQPMGIEGSHKRLMAELQERARAEQHRRTQHQERAALPPLPEPGDFSEAAVMAIVKRCDYAEATTEDLEALRALLKERGAHLANTNHPLRQALEREIREMPGSPLARELSSDALAKRRKALGYAEAPALEKPLIDHLLLCELRLANTEQGYTVLAVQNKTIEQARYWDSKLAGAQRRYLAAVEALARVRRVRVELARVLPDGTAEAVAVEKPGS